MISGDDDDDDVDEVSDLNGADDVHIHTMLASADGDVEIVAASDCWMRPRLGYLLPLLHSRWLVG